MRQIIVFIAILSIHVVLAILIFSKIIIFGQYTMNGTWLAIVMLAYNRLLSWPYLISLATIWSVIVSMAITMNLLQPT